MPTNTALLDHQFSADGTSDSVEWDPKIHGTRGSAMVSEESGENSLGGGTLTLQWSRNNVVWIDNTNVEFTAADPSVDNFELPAGWIRFSLTGATAPTARAFVHGHRI